MPRPEGPREDSRPGSGLPARSSLVRCRPGPSASTPTMPPSPAAVAAWQRELIEARANPLPGPVMLDRQLAVCGPRYSEKGSFGGWALTSPEPVVTLPLQLLYDVMAANAGSNRTTPQAGRSSRKSGSPWSSAGSIPTDRTRPPSPTAPAR